MKKILTCISFLAAAFLFNSCTKTESDFTLAVPESITIKADATEVIAGNSITFTVTSSLNNNAIVTGQSSLYVNGTLIAGNTYTFTSEGNYLVNASKGTLNSNIISIKVTPATSSATRFVNRVLVEEFSGTWCGNCPAILYGVDLLKQQTDKSIVVSVHLFNDDPYITSQGNTLAANLGVTGVPAGKINRTVNWDGLQYQHVNQVTDQIKASETLGLGISSTLSGSNLNASITVSYAQTLSGDAKLTLYLVEDKLIYTQRNYSSTLYAGQASIPNFEYNGVIRAIVSTLAGDAVANTGTAVQKNYSVSLPNNITDIGNLRLVAFITNSTGIVINAQEAKVGTIKSLEKL
ncbi:MAG: Omp28-related outer membrane protein [Ferruginibacter sp.]